MLKSLQIENIAIIEKASIGFSDGLNVLTGETGAGKSIIIDSINAVTGEKTSRELIRTGESSAFVNALFCDISDNIKALLEENGLPVEADGTLLLQRRLYKDGKNACRVNGMNVTVSMLKSIGMKLINIHGQRDSQELLDAERHIDFVDSFAHNSDLLNKYRESFEKLCLVQSKIRSLQKNEAEKERKIDLLTYQINELEAADIKPGEAQKLNKQKTFLNNSVKLASALKNAVIALNGDGEINGSYSLMNSAQREINSVVSITKELSQLCEMLENAKNTVDEVSGVLDDVLRQLEDIDGDINLIEERLDLLYKLSKKYGQTEEEMLAFLENAKEELDNINLSEEKQEELKKEEIKLLEETEALAENLTQCRKTAGEKLSQAIIDELRFLDMPNVIFVCKFSETPFSDKGKDSIEFLISANPGEEPKPLNKTASGGELSRIMLAMKSVLTSKDGADTLIFDEVDSGVSGSAAGKIAVKLSKVAKNAQVLCITHLAQIAAFADEHYFLSKSVVDSKTYTSVKVLNVEERAKELARITFGDNADTMQIYSAEQMIIKANQQKLQ